MAAATIVCCAAWSVIPFRGDDGASAAGPAACFGAAARDPEHPCVNPQLAYTVRPTPEDALLEPSAPCTLLKTATPEVCEFGISRRKPASVALLGDSHAVHWRAALAVVARVERWRGVSITRSRCRFSLAVTPGKKSCVAWARSALRWLRSHPKIRTIFVSADVGAGKAAEQFRTTKLNGFKRMWKALPASVREVFVIHDVPHGQLSTSACVERASARHHDPGVGCARPRSVALHEDFQAVAAEQYGGGTRVKLIDLTQFMCDASRCFPVVGGALVIKDIGHLTRTFSTTLGPFLERAIAQLRVPGQTVPAAPAG